MKIVRDLHKMNKSFQNSILTIGNFDGIHIGHQRILKQVKKIAKEKNSKSALLTFEPHPLKIINPAKYQNIKIINLADKLRILKQENLVDIVFIVSFNRYIANLEAKDFVKEILVNKLKIQDLIIGYDFIFGKDRLGNAALLKQLSQDYDFNLHQIDAKKDHEKQIYSSTKIRKFISNGKIEAANKMLGRNYQISSMVIKGQQIARKIGFPTVNLLPKKDLIKPKFGVYKANVLFQDNKYKAIVNFGIKPTFGNNQAIFEAYIFNFNQEIYGQKIVIELVDFIREEKKFDGVDELKEQIRKDIDVLILRDKQ